MFQRLRAEVANSWRPKPRDYAVTFCIMLGFALDYLAIRVILPHLPFTPQFRMAHDIDNVFMQLMLGNKAVIQPLFNQLAVCNITTHLVIALITGIMVGVLVRERMLLAQRSATVADLTSFPDQRPGTHA